MAGMTRTKWIIANDDDLNYHLWNPSTDEEHPHLRGYYDKQKLIEAMSLFGYVMKGEVIYRNEQ